MKKFFLGMALATASTLTLSTAASAKTLTIATWLSPNNAVNSVFLPKLAQEIENRTEGRVKAKIEYDLSPPNGYIELVEYGGADIAWTFNGYFPGRLITPKLVEIPGFEANSKVASVAYWRTHQKYLKDANEFEGVEVIGQMVHGATLLFMRPEISSLKDLAGRKLRLGGGLANEAGIALQASPVMIPANKTYETISGGMVDGTMLPADVIPTMRLNEAAPNAYLMPGGFYRGAMSIFMNPNALDDIDPKDQAAIREYFGEQLSADAGAAWDLDYDKGLELQRKTAKVHQLSDEDVALFRKLTESIRDKVIEEVNSKGVDGKAAYDFLMDTITELNKAG